SPEALNVPDPAQLFDVDAGVVSLLSKTDDAEFGEQSREGREIVQEVTGTLPGQAIIDLLNVGEDTATFEVTYALVEEDWQVRTVTLTGPFYPQAESTYTVTLDQYGEPVTVTAP
ncbi:MAG: LppX_LprAFG lipoprotein, partial [Actinomycetota bacterium]|nr:LppX_LprAFG lipoprotein [Actinomycetota bacterium]